MAAEPARVLVDSGDGSLRAVVGERVRSGVRVEDGVIYPDELLRPLGGGTYVLASAVMMPGDGDLSRVGDVADDELVRVDQLQWVAHWRAYCEARERLNWESLFAPSSVAVHNVFRSFVLAVVLCAALLASWQVWGVKGEIQQLRASASGLAAQVELLRGSPGAGWNPGVNGGPDLTPTPGASR